MREKGGQKALALLKLEICFINGELRHDTHPSSNSQSNLFLGVMVELKQTTGRY